MYEIIKNVLNGRNYNLTSMLNKIDTLWAKEKLSDEEYNELTELARTYAQTANSIDVIAKLNDFEQRLRTLEEKSADGSAEECPAYVIGKWYYNGDTCSFEDKNYICIAPEGVVCTWSPIEYPSYWEVR